MATIVSLILSFVVTASPWDSIFPNIFAGLLTGLVVTLINSLKSRSIRNIEIERGFLNTLHEQYISSNKQYYEYRKKRYSNDDEYFTALYDLATEMYSVETFIEQINGNVILIRTMGNRPSEIFKKENDYDLDEQNKRHKELIEIIDSKVNYDENIREEIDERIKIIRSAHFALNHKVFNLMGSLSDQKIEIETSIL